MRPFVIFFLLLLTNASYAPSQTLQPVSSLVLIDEQSIKLVAEFRTAFAAARMSAMQLNNEADIKYLDRAEREELKDLTVLEKKKLSQYSLWALSQDIKLLRQYQESGESDYLRAAVEDVSEMVATNQLTAIKEKTVTITVNTVRDGERAPVPGYQICFTSTKWAHLPKPPTGCYSNRSSSSEDFPINRGITFWSRSYQDQSKVGSPMPDVTNESKSIDIGIPPTK